MSLRQSEPAITPIKTRLVWWIGLLAIIGGALMIIAGGVVWGTVSSQLSEQHISVSEDAAFLAGRPVAGPFTALAQADIIEHHAMKMSGGKTYAELKQDDPLRSTVMNASFLRASLFTSVVSFGVSAFAIGAGLLFALLGSSTMALSRVRSRSLAPNDDQPKAVVA